MHNGIVNSGADENFNATFAPFTMMLQVIRQDGTVGTAVVAEGVNGEEIRIVPEGFAKQRSVEVLAQHRETRKIVRARGDLDHLDKLPKGAFPDGYPRHIIAVVTNPEVRVSVDSCNNLSGAILKIALHFYHGFIGDVDRKVAHDLLNLIVSGNKGAGTYVRTAIYDEAFPDMETPRHEITCYPCDADSCLVTVLLFGGYAYVVRLPFPMPGTSGIRYRQALDRTFPEFFDDVVVPKKLSWDCHPKSAHEHRQWANEAQKRISRLHDRGIERSVQARCKRAFQRALRESSNFGNLWERYRAALQVEAFEARQVDSAVRIGQYRHSQGLPPWEVSVQNISDSDE